MINLDLVNKVSREFIERSLLKDFINDLKCLKGTVKDIINKDPDDDDDKD